jgi:hypothetical protein
MRGYLTNQLFVCGLWTIASVAIYGPKRQTSTQTVARDDLSALRKMRKATNGPWVFETERGGPQLDWAMSCIPTCCATELATR